MTDRENDALRATNIEQAAEIGILRTEKHADAEAIGSQAAEIERLRKHAARIDRLFTACNVLSEASEPDIDDNGNGYIVVPAFEFIQFEAFLSDYAALAQEAQTDE